jgi:UrcA family protein
MRILFASIIALTCATGTSFAEELRQVRVSTAGINIDRTADVATLHRDIVRAARTACGLNEFRTSARVYVQRRACVRETVDTTVEVAGISALSDLHASLSTRARYNLG